MTLTRFDATAYLNRIGFNGRVRPNRECLEALHNAHFYTIPFENFDVLLGRDIDLDPDAVFNKLVNRKRGGYCFEMNGLFLRALKAFGFEARPLLARVHVTGTPSGRGHQISLVTIPGDSPAETRQWIADVGFGGDTPRMPVPFELDRPVTCDGQTVRLIDGDRFGVMLQGLKENQWQNFYSFELHHVCHADIEYGNHFASTHPDSLFTGARVASLPVPGGGITLLDHLLKITRNGKEKIQRLKTGQAYIDALKAYFGIELDAEYGDLGPCRDTANPAIRI